MNLTTMRSASILLFTFLSRHRHLGATAFLTSSKEILSRARPSSFNSQGINLPTSATISSSSLGSLPSTSQVEADDFMKQLGHASQIIPLLYPQNPDQNENQIIQIDDDTLSEILAKQLSHSDGIRGFFAVYLTSPESLTTEEVPPILAEAVRGADEEIFVPLACMNVLMPTAMTSIHQDPELQECASKTANNGKKILRLVRDKDLVKKNCAAILNVCGGNASECGTDVVDGDLIEYWEKFFVNYKYKEKQKEDIAVAIAEFC